MPRNDAKDEIYVSERKEADGWPHRRHDLEAAIVNLQFGPFAERVQAALDKQRAGLPPIEEQDEEDRLWRLAMHRMDLRRYAVANETTEVALVPGGGTPAQQGRNYVRLELGEPEPDIKEMVELRASELEPINARVSLLSWARAVFAEGGDAGHDPSQWRVRLADARTIDATTNSMPRKPEAIMLFTALPPAPPTPNTVIRGLSSVRSGTLRLIVMAAFRFSIRPFVLFSPAKNCPVSTH